MVQSAGRGVELDAIEAVYRRELARFVRVAAAIAGDEQDGWEAVQEAVAGVIRDRGSFRDEGPVEAWMWRAVVNAARSRRRRQRITGSEIVEAAAASVDRERGQLVRGAVGSLPERQRIVLFLRFYADLSYEEIGQVVGVSANTVGPTLAAAQAGLRRLLGEEVRHD
jgi:RNA polymerase sigma factor (sigma-70 family)